VPLYAHYPAPPREEYVRSLEEERGQLEQRLRHLEQELEQLRQARRPAGEPT
jgi:hypothetical protein